MAEAGSVVLTGFYRAAGPDGGQSSPGREVFASREEALSRAMGLLADGRLALASIKDATTGEELLGPADVIDALDAIASAKGLGGRLW